MQEKVEIILSSANLTWFTDLLEWERVKRYVVAFTNNTERSLELLAAQAWWFSNLHENITIGWRTDPQWKVFIDIWTSTDSIEEARVLQKQYFQQAIRDTGTEEEIR